MNLPISLPFTIWQFPPAWALPLLPHAPSCTTLLTALGSLGAFAQEQLYELHVIRDFIQFLHTSSNWCVYISLAVEVLPSFNSISFTSTWCLLLPRLGIA